MFNPLRGVDSDVSVIGTPQTPRYCVRFDWGAMQLLCNRQALQVPEGPQIAVSLVGGELVAQWHKPYPGQLPQNVTYEVLKADALRQVRDLKA